MVISIVDRPERSEEAEDPRASERQGPRDPSKPEDARQPPTQAQVDSQIDRLLSPDEKARERANNFTASKKRAIFARHFKAA